MIKQVISNNLVSLGYHICIFLILIFTMGLFSGSVNNKFLAQFYNIGMVLFALFVIFLYLNAGFRFKPTDTYISDFLSFILVGIIGLLIWIFALQDTHNSSCMHDLNDEAITWWFYEFYYLGIDIVHHVIDKIVNIDYCNVEAYVIATWNLIPTSLMFFGIEIRRMYEKKRKCNKSLPIG